MVQLHFADAVNVVIDREDTSPFIALFTPLRQIPGNEPRAFSWGILTLPHVRFAREAISPVKNLTPQNGMPC